jgi:pimeloyl-ACP methyl ester carboxylesterase
MAQCKFCATPLWDPSSHTQERRVTASARYRVLTVALLTLCSVQPSLAAEGGAVVKAEPAPSSIVIGFVGGFVRHNNPHHGPVVFARHLRAVAPKDAYIQVFENRHRKSAYQTILRLLDRDHDGILSADEKSQARIILYGHSWGASAAVMLARELNRSGIPVLLTVQVDSVAKFWQEDGIIPANVSAAVNFYQPHGIIHGRQQITAADPARTQILGNFRTDYKQHPVQCEGYSWADHFFTSGHMQSECDPQTWSQVEALMSGRFAPEPSAVAALPH